MAIFVQACLQNVCRLLSLNAITARIVTAANPFGKLTRAISTSMSLKRIRIVLVQPSHGGNIGGCARHEEHGSDASGAGGAGGISRARRRVHVPLARTTLLAQARVCATLDEAIADCHLVIGASARERRIAWPMLAPAAAAPPGRHGRRRAEVAVLFGRERTGLTNDEQLDRCQILVNIPANPEFSSLNLACAVQVIAYEIRCAAETGDAAAPTDAAEMLGEPLATSAEVNVSTSISTR